MSCREDKWRSTNPTSFPRQSDTLLSNVIDGRDCSGVVLWQLPPRLSFVSLRLQEALG